MISSSTSTCPTCGGKLKPYDKVLRIVRTKGRKTKRVSIRRLRCTECGGLHREIPQYICPYKQYEKDVIQGVLEGLITCETLGYEDSMVGFAQIASPFMEKSISIKEEL